MFAAKRSELLLTQIAKRNNSHVSKQNSPYFHGLSAFCVRFKSTGTALQGTIPIMGKGVQVGQHAELQRIFTTDEVDQFGSLIEDKNFLHTTMPWNDDAKERRENSPVCDAHLEAGLIRPEEEDGTLTIPLVHGMLVSSIFSSMFASLAPGCVYVNQTLNFVAPLFANQTVIGRIEIMKIRKWRKGGCVVECDTQVQCLVGETKYVTGIANVWLPEGSPTPNKL